MDILLNPEPLSELDAEQASWTNADRVPPSVALRA
jgi:hypothetical protein